MMNRQCSQCGSQQPYEELMPVSRNGNGCAYGFQDQTNGGGCRCRETFNNVSYPNGWSGYRYQDGWNAESSALDWNEIWSIRSMTDLADLVCGCVPPIPVPPPHPGPPGPGPARISVTLRKTDDQGNPLSGAVFRLQQYQGFDLLTEATGTDGTASALLIPNCYYVLSEIQAPPGYIPTSETHYIYVTCNGVVYVDGVITETPTFVNTPENQPTSVIFRKQNQGAQPLPGALFTLHGEGTFRTAYSDINGFVTFDAVYPGTYTLVETIPPAGYAPNTTQNTVVITTGGAVTINGIPVQDFTVTNVPMP